MTYTFQFLRNGAVIPGAVTQTYTLTNADVGGFISCRVTATNAGGSQSAESDRIGPVKAAQTTSVADTRAPVITSTMQRAFELKTALRNRVTARVTSNERITLSSRLTVTRTQARALKLRCAPLNGRCLIGKANVSRVGNTYRLTYILTPAAKARIAQRNKSIDVGVTFTARDAAGNITTRNRAVRFVVPPPPAYTG
jgi:hypothetical protein